MKLKRRNNKKKLNFKRSPCSGCVREDKSKNKGACVKCAAPAKYAEAVKERTPYVKAIDYRDVYVSRSASIRQFIDEVSIL